MNIESTPDFLKAMAKLDSAERVLVLKRIRGLGQEESFLGKRLGGQLRFCFSIRTGFNHRLRVIVLDRDKQRLLVTVGPREDLAVYTQAIRIISELER